MKTHIKTEWLIVSRVELQKDRILLYPLLGNFHVIAPLGADVKKGDRVLYEVMGVNFGWFIKVKWRSNAC